MKNVLAGFVVVCLVCLSPAIAQSQASQYQQGKIVAVQKLPSQPTSESEDASLQGSVDEYDISVQVGDIIYVCRYDAPGGEDKTWLNGKEGPVRIKGKAIYVKRASGDDARATIVRTTKANTP